MAIHELRAEQQSLHGVFSPELEPVLTIDPGDTVRFTTADARWGLSKGVRVSPRVAGWERGHALTGPVYIRGARPGMTLAVQIGHLRPGNWGWNSGGGSLLPINQRLGIAGEEHRLWVDWEIDSERMIARNQFGHSVALRPFLGVIGMPPAEPGAHPTRPPRATGGNIDCKELVPGSTLYLPIAVEGALVSVGDGHAAQGDGEVSWQGIECAMESAEIRFDLVERSLTMPRAQTPAGWITFGFHEDLNEASVQALEGMVRLIEELYGADPREALALASVAVDLRVTQTVNAVQGVHAVLPYGAIR